jgi:uncharacterized membrane protein YoaK (UPF0700 family)
MNDKELPSQVLRILQANEKDTRIRDALIVTLAFTSGFIDALAYLGLGGVFVSNMTGNTILLGLAISEGKIFAAARSTTSLLGYLSGVAIGASITNPKTKREKNSATSKTWPLVATTSFTMECIVLLFFAVGGYLASENPIPILIYALIALSSIAMGMQSVGVQALGVRGIATTYITGTWTMMVTTLTHKSLPKNGATASTTNDNTRVQALVLAFYVVAAILSGTAERGFFLKAALVPVFAIAIVVLSARKWF